MPIEYTCSVCGELFTQSWTEEDAVEELHKTFPGFEPKDCDIVCDICYKRIFEEMRHD